MIADVTKAVGSEGLVGGQAVDIQMEVRQIICRNGPRHAIERSSSALCISDVQHMLARQAAGLQRLGRRSLSGPLSGKEDKLTPAVPKGGGAAQTLETLEYIHAHKTGALLEVGAFRALLDVGAASDKLNRRIRGRQQ